MYPKRTYIAHFQTGHLTVDLRLLMLPAFRSRSEDSTSAPGADGLPPARARLDGLHAGYFASFHCKSQHGADKVPSTVAVRAGIHVEQSQRGVHSLSGNAV
jgi:hypothetical protein